MLNEEVIESQDDIVTDITFNYYCTQFATSSSGEYVKLYSQNKNGKWEKYNSFKCNGPIQKVQWAHPKFGSIIGTSYSNKYVSILEERKYFENDQITQKEKKQNMKSSWIVKWEITDIQEFISDIKFSPQSKELQLAIGLHDGKILIYQMNEENSIYQYRIISEFLAMGHGVSCLSWNKSQYDSESLAIGGFKSDENKRKPTLQEDEMGMQIQDSMGQSQFMNKNSSNTLSILMNRGQEEFIWTQLKVFDTCETINDVSWANKNGRSFHLLAATENQGLKIWKIILRENQLIICQSMKIDKQPQFGWKLSWNMMGTLIGTSYKNQEIQIYKRQNDVWICQGFQNDQK